VLHVADLEQQIASLCWANTGPLVPKAPKELLAPESSVSEDCKSLPLNIAIDFEFCGGRRCWHETGKLTKEPA
jgi:hypothetical protein